MLHICGLFIPIKDICHLPLPILGLPCLEFVKLLGSEFIFFAKFASLFPYFFLAYISLSSCSGIPIIHILWNLLLFYGPLGLGLSFFVSLFFSLYFSLNSFYLTVFKSTDFPLFQCPICS